MGRFEDDWIDAMGYYFDERTIKFSSKHRSRNSPMENHPTVLRLNGVTWRRVHKVDAKTAIYQRSVS